MGKNKKPSRPIQVEDFQGYDAIDMEGDGKQVIAAIVNFILDNNLTGIAFPIATDEGDLLEVLISVRLHDEISSYRKSLT